MLGAGVAGKYNLPLLPETAGHEQKVPHGVDSGGRRRCAPARGGADSTAVICRGCGWLVQGEVCPKCARSVHESDRSVDAGGQLVVVRTDAEPRQVKVYDSVLSRLTPWLLGVFLPMALLLTVLSVFVVRIDYFPSRETEDSGRIRYEAAIVGIWQSDDGGTDVCFRGDQTGYAVRGEEKSEFIYIVAKDKIYIYSNAKTTIHLFRLKRGKLILSNGQQECGFRRVDGGVSL